MSTLQPRETLDRQIQELFDEVLVLGSMVEQAVTESIEALKARDFEAARRIYFRDQEINKKHYEIENKCLIVIATQQPMARDLRILAAILEVVTELERMGDYAKGIARANVLIGDKPLMKPLIDIPRMADISLDMLHRSLGALVAQDVEAARKIPDEDDMIDALYNQIYRELFTYMVADPSTIDQSNHLLWVAHNLERIGDRVTNICERIVFVVTGEISEMDVSDDEIEQKFYEKLTD